MAMTQQEHQSLALLHKMRKAASGKNINIVADAMMYFIAELCFESAERDLPEALNGADALSRDIKEAVRIIAEHGGGPIIQLRAMQ